MTFGAENFNTEIVKPKISDLENKYKIGEKAKGINILVEECVQLINGMKTLTSEQTEEQKAALLKYVADNEQEIKTWMESRINAMDEKITSGEVTDVDPWSPEYKNMAKLLILRVLEVNNIDNNLN